MTESTAPRPTENVQRGLLFSLGSILVGVVGFVILSGVIGIYGIVTGAATSLLAEAFASFTRVGGDGGFFAPDEKP